MPHKHRPVPFSNLHPTPLPTSIKLQGPNPNIRSRVKKDTS